MTEQIDTQGVRKAHGLSQSKNKGTNESSIIGIITNGYETNIKENQSTLLLFNDETISLWHC